MRIDEAPAITSPSGSEIIPVANSGAPGSISVDALKGFIVAAVNTGLSEGAHMSTSQMVSAVLGAVFSLASLTPDGSTMLLGKASNGTNGKVTLSQILSYVTSNLPGVSNENLATITSAVKTAFYEASARTSPAGTDILPLRIPQQGANPATDATISLSDLLAYVLDNLPDLSSAQMASIKTAVEGDLFGDAVTPTTDTKLPVSVNGTIGSLTIGGLMDQIYARLTNYIGHRVTTPGSLIPGCFMPFSVGSTDYRARLDTIAEYGYTNVLPAWIAECNEAQPSFADGSTDKLLLVRSVGGVPVARQVSLPELRTALLSGEQSSGGPSLPGFESVSNTQSVPVLDASEVTVFNVLSGSRILLLRYYVSEAISVTDITDESNPVVKPISPSILTHNTSTTSTTHFELGTNVTSVPAGQNAGNLTQRIIAFAQNNTPVYYPIVFNLGFTPETDHIYRYAGRISVAVTYQSMIPLTE